MSVPERGTDGRTVMFYMDTVQFVYMVVGLLCAFLLAYTLTPPVRVLAFKIGAHHSADRFVQRPVAAAAYADILILPRVLGKLLRMTAVKRCLNGDAVIILTQTGDNTVHRVFGFHFSRFRINDKKRSFQNRSPLP